MSDENAPKGNWVPASYASRHSPGPWEWVPFKNWDGGLRAANGEYVISNDETDNTPENPHDAALIASAPEMLALLRELAVAREEGWYEDNRAWEGIDSRLASLLDRLGRS